jgi:VanW like protein
VASKKGRTVSESTAGTAPRRSASFTPPTARAALLFEAKALVFKTLRLARDVANGPSRLARGVADAGGVTAGESRTPLWGDTKLSERGLQWGKVHNLRIAARALDGTLIPAGKIFSFWKQMGRPTRARGFANGRMLREGCLIPSAGGGLCQLSNALYDVALQAGCEIVERHGHSRIVPGSAAALGRDATVAWNYVDLRFRAPRPLVLRVVVARDMLDVRLVAPDGGTRVSFDPQIAPPSQDTGEAIESCDTCDETSCFRHEHKPPAPAGRTAFLVDENWPEFRDYISRTRKDGDVLSLPIDGARWRMPRYAWETKGFAHIRTASVPALARSVAQRFAAQGPARRKLELRSAERIARTLARLLTPDVTALCIAQSLLPTLWRDGHLGGREFSVLMTRLPMAEIQSRLDVAARAHSERKTLADFRADPALIAAEREALEAADAIVTPHAEIARLFGERAVLLDWHMPKSASRCGEIVPRRIAFPGPTIARKGAYELRDAVKALDLEIVPLGSELEGADFWSGVRTRHPDPADPFAGVAAVVQPALVEESPRRLLAALAKGIPVIATPACGLPAQPGLTLVYNDDELIAALHEIA